MSRQYIEEAWNLLKEETTNKPKDLPDNLYKEYFGIGNVEIESIYDDFEFDTDLDEIEKDTFSKKRHLLFAMTTNSYIDNKNGNILGILLGTLYCDHFKSNLDHTDWSPDFTMDSPAIYYLANNNLFKPVKNNVVNIDGVDYKIDDNIAADYLMKNFEEVVRLSPEFIEELNDSPIDEHGYAM